MLHYSFCCFLKLNDSATPVAHVNDAVDTVDVVDWLHAAVDADIVLVASFMFKPCSLLQVDAQNCCFKMFLLEQQQKTANYFPTFAVMASRAVPLETVA